MTDNEIRRINRQIEQSFKKLGGGSSQTAAYLNLLSKLPENAVRTSASGIPQISRSKSAINALSSEKSEKILNKLSKEKTVGEIQKYMLKKFTERTGITPKGKEKTKAIREEAIFQENIQTELHELLYELYEIEKKMGIHLKALDDISELSRGRRTRTEDLIKMIEIARAEINKADHEIITSYFEGL